MSREHDCWCYGEGSVAVLNAAVGGSLGVERELGGGEVLDMIAWN